jgi:hypothetical protein
MALQQRRLAARAANARHRARVRSCAELAALVADMLEEIDELRARLRRAGLA